MALRSISLCAGIGGIDLGLAQWAKTVCYVEREAFSASVLVARMEKAALDLAPVWSDLRTFDARAWRGSVDLVTGGYPCQPFSVAGKRGGAADERHLWPEVLRILKESGASLGFFENVRGHLTLGFQEVLEDLSAGGWDAEWCVLRASDVGAPHRRERLFVLAFRGDVGREKLADAESTGQLRAQPAVDDRQDGARGVGRADDDDAAGAALEHAASRDARSTGSAQHGDGGCAGTAGAEVGHPDNSGLEGRGLRELGGTHERAPWPPGPEDEDDWNRYSGPQPVLRRGVDGLSAFVDRSPRLQALGNAVVPAQAALAFRLLTQRILEC